MNRIFSNRQFFRFIIVLIVSSLIVTGVSLYVAYNKAKILLQDELTNTVEQQKLLIETLLIQGKNKVAVLQFLSALYENDSNGRITKIIVNQQDSTNAVLLSNSRKKETAKADNTISLPHFLSVKDKIESTQHFDIKSISYYTAYTFLPSLNWHIVAQTPTSQLWNSFRSTSAPIISIFLIFIILCIFLTITYKILYKKLADNEVNYHNLYNNKHINMLLIDPQNGNLVDASHSACLFYGYERKKMQRLSIFDINVYPRKEIEKEINAIMRGEKSHFVFKHKLANGSLRDVEVSTGTVQLKGKTIICSIVSDITERKMADRLLKQRAREIEEQNEEYLQINEELIQANEELLLANREIEDSENRYKRITAGITDYMYTVKIKNGQAIETIHNEACLTVTGYLAEEFAQDPYLWINMVLPEDREWVAGRFSNLLQGKDLSPLEHRIVRKNGSIRWISDMAIPKYDENGVLISYDGIIKDITERKMAEEKIRISEERLRNAHEAATDAIWDYDFITSETYFSNQWYKILGYRQKDRQVSIKQWIELIHPDDKKHTLEVIKQAFADGSKFAIEVRNQHADGHWVWCLIKGMVTERDAKCNPIRISGTYSDISLRKKYEQELIETQHKLQIKSDEYQALNKEYITINEELNESNELLQANIRELIKAKEHAEESDRLKTAFLQNMSHEIRTPMNAIMGFSGLLVENYNNRAKLEKFSEIITQRCNDLLDIINDILDIAKIESGQLTINNEECNMNLLFGELTMFFREHQKRIGKQHIAFKLLSQCSASENLIITDKVKLKQIFINLIGNAFKFTETGKIEGGCRLDKSKKNLIMYISDTGIGIRPEKQEVIFDRFAQIDNGNSKLYGGTGLGLSIVKGLVDLLGGEIRVESESGKGATFYFSIPYKPVQNAKIEMPFIDKGQTYYFPNKTVLIVEDDAFNAEYLKEILSYTGLTILHTPFGEKAIQMSTSQSVDLALMDIRLPDISGYQAIAIIKMRRPNMKIIAQTAFASHNERQKAIKAGCCDFISKPIKQELLLNMISKQLSM
jgi:PAS domain S-box-containing protein